METKPNVAVLQMDLAHARYEVERLRIQVEDMAKTNARLVVENEDLKELLRKVPAHYR